MSNKPVIGITLDRNEAGGYSKFPWYAVRENYCASIVEMGGVPLPLPHFPEFAEDYLNHLDGLVITGGDFDIDPSFYNADSHHQTIKVKACRTAFELAITKAALAKNIPVLGICGGQQLINVALGGTLIQHIPDEVENALQHSHGHQLCHNVTLSPDTMLLKIAGQSEISVNSSHHQAIKDLGKGLVVNAKASDGVIEGIEAPGYKFCMGLQWHPEYFNTATDRAIYQAFMSAVSQ